MEETMRCWLLLLFASFVVPFVALAQEHHSTVKPSPEFEQMKKLVGKWEGMAGNMPAKTEFRLTGDGSALMEIMAQGTPYEMVTMYHMDGDRFLATHYCAAHNQPRMEALHGDGKTVQFKYIDGTNIAAGDVHMENVKMTLADADHHKELWTSTENGKSEDMEFDFHRVK